MEYPKRLRSSYDNDSKRKRFNKTRIDSNDLLIKFVTRFEDLSNEIIYEVFDFLDFRHVYDAFANLNQRFQDLLINSTFPININMSSISKSNFQNYYAYIIIPNAHRIKFLHLSNPLSIDLFFAQVSIVIKFTRLETLILNNTESKDIKKLLTYLVPLPCLSSLVISCMDNGRKRNSIYRKIFRLPMLKYCKISLSDCYEVESPLLIAINEFSPIEHLIINNSIKMNHLIALLSYVPQLRRLFVDNLWPSDVEQIISRSIKLNHLTHASLNMTDVTFDQFASSAKHLFLQLQVLYITATRDETYLDANRWKRLILSYMSHLRIFHIQYEDFPNKNYYSTDAFTIESFRSQFWLERRWFFTSSVESVDDDCYRFLFSTNPFRRKSYTLYGNPDKDMVPSCQKQNINSVRYVHIEQEQGRDECRKYFPNATELTLNYKVIDVDRNPPSIILNHIIPLAQLTKLNINVSINVHSFPFKTMIKLLDSIPNIHTLTAEYVCFDKTDVMSIQQTETFQSISTRNNIKNLTIDSRYKYEEIKLFIHLCSRLQSLTMCAPDDDFEGTLRYLLSKNNDNTRYLCFLCVTTVHPKELEITKTVTESKETVDDYLMKRVTQEFSDDVYFWW